MSDSTGFCRHCEWSLEHDERNWQTEGEDEVYTPKSVKKIGEETEKQVEAHLDSHLNRLPKNDLRSRKIVEQMKADEIKHGQTAHHAGAAELPFIVKKIMGLQSKVMTNLTYWV